MSKHANSAHRSLREWINGLVTWKANSAHRSHGFDFDSHDLFRLPGIVPRYAFLVHGHNSDFRYRWIMAWTRSGLEAKLDFRRKAIERVATISGAGNLDFRWRDHVAVGAGRRA